MTPHNLTPDEFLAALHGEHKTRWHWVGIIEADLANFRAVLDWSVATGQPDDGLRLCLALAPFSGWHATRTVSGWFAVALAIPGGQDRELRAHIAAWDAWSSGFRSRLERFREQVALMEQAYRDAGIPLDTQALAALTTLAAQEGRLPEAVDLLDDALAVTTVADTFDRSFFLGTRAVVLAVMGRTDDAVDSAEQAVAAANERGSISERARADAALGLALADIDPERAIIHLERSRASRHEIGDLAGANSGYRRLARLRATTGDLPAALAVYAEELALWIPELDHFDVVLTCESLAVDLSGTEHHDITSVLFGALDAPADDYQGNPSVGRPKAAEELRARLGDDRYRALAERGRAMSPAEMLDYARTETDRLLAELTDQ